jgi:hypothetical protein
MENSSKKDEKELKNLRVQKSFYFSNLTKNLLYTKLIFYIEKKIIKKIYNVLM